MATTPRARKTATNEEAPTVTEAPTDSETAPTADPFALFETVRFPGRGRVSTVGEFDEMVSSAMERRNKYVKEGVDPAKIFTVLDLSDLKAGKELDSYRSKVINAAPRVAPGFKVEFRSLPESETVRSQYVQYEAGLGGESLKTATHVFRLVPKPVEAPAETAQADAETAPAETEA